MIALRILPEWGPQTWFDLVLCIATGVEAAALWFLYKLERRQDERNTRVELPIRMYEYTPVNKEGMQTDPSQPMIEVMNCSATSVYIEEVMVEAESENGTKNGANDKTACLVKPYSSEKLNLYFPMARVVEHLVRNSGVDNQAGRVIRTQVQITLRCRAYGRLSATQPASFNGGIIWGEFHLR
jgi:hypothetical protein